MAITLKKLSGDTEVIANPTLDGSETALSGLQIDGVKYAMGGGGSLNWVLKESVYCTNNTTSNTTGNYKDKVVCITTTDYTYVLPVIVRFLNCRLFRAKNDTEIYVDAVVSGDSTLSIKNTTGSTMTFKIYELEVA
jgi:hypothetical protein